MPVPVVVGVADVKNASLKVEDAVEPMQLMCQAIREAAEDAGSSSQKLLSSIDSVAIVRTWTWPYADLPSLLSGKLGTNPKYKHYTEHGGNQPGKIFDDAARQILKGDSKVAVVTGGEALASLSACAAAGKLPPDGWSAPETNVEAVFSPTNRDLGDNLGAIHGVGAPIHIYPLFENAFRAHRKQSFAENNTESARLYAGFAKVAERNPYAWNYGRSAATEQLIGSVSKKNRMICFPYPLLMNAFNTVNLAGACILTSTDYARELGIPESKWIYPLGGAGTRDSNEFWNRPNYYSSPSISRSLDAALQTSGLRKEQIDLYDFYSCFPIVPKLAADHLGLTINGGQSLTLLGGLTSFGGAGNNYSMHALTEMVRQLRKGGVRNGLVLANGGVVTYQYVVCLSTQPRDAPYPHRNPLPAIVTDVSVPTVDVRATGEAMIETYTVEFDRDGGPSRGFVVCRLKKNGHRVLANTADPSTTRELLDPQREPIGRTGAVFVDGETKGRNLFSFDLTANL